MTNRFLISFDRGNNLKSDADLWEKAEHIGLGLLRIGFGKTVTVEKISNKTGPAFTEKVYSAKARAAAIALFVLALPITALLAGIGCIGMAYSKWPGEIFDSYVAQKQVRDFLARKDYPRSKEAVIVIQKQARDCLARRGYYRNRSAAITIQKQVRGYQKRKAHLPRGLFPQYLAQCKLANSPGPHSMPKAADGKTRVWLPREIPGVVLKASGREEAIKRFHEMQQVRSILNSQNSSHLIIPKANLCENFLVEERLPINVDSYHNMGLYISHPQLFDEAVREMTRLFSRGCIADLVSEQDNPLGNIKGVGNQVRHDNLPLYIVEENGKKEGKIGLIDLEHFQNSPSPEGLETLVRIFPLHIDMIKEEARKLRMKVYGRCLETARKTGMKYLQVGFVDHLEWLKQKSVPTHSSLQSFQVSPKRVEELTTSVEKELLKLNQGINGLYKRSGKRGVPQKNFLTENPEKMARELAANITPLIVNNIKASIEKRQNEKLSGTPSHDMTDSELVSIRSPVLKREKFYTGAAELIKNNGKVKFAGRYYYSALDIVEQLTFVIMEELIKSREMFCFDPAYYTEGHDLCWIRY